jgi:hypothetical protein
VNVPQWLRWLTLGVALQFISLVFPLHAHGNSVDRCLIEGSPNQHVSLGFPVLEERIHNEPRPRVLVLPFRLSDTPNFIFTPDMRRAFLDAGKRIEALSGGKSKIEFVFSDVINLKDSVRDMIALRDNQGRSYRSDESASTFGFVRRVITEVDEMTDYQGIDAVFLQGSSNVGATSIAEAMMLRRGSSDQWFRAIDTKEGPILNAVLTDSPKDVWTIVHELLHLYGLTDLYGSQSAPVGLSIMAGGPEGLLNHEKWILGWHSNSNVACFDMSTESNARQEVVDFRIPRSDKEHLHIFKLAERGTALIVETGQRPLGSSNFEYLAFYSLNNEARPPIDLHSSKLTSRGDGNVVSIQNDANLDLIATLLDAKEHSLIISDLTEAEIVLHLVRRDAPSEVTKVLLAAESKKIERLAAAEYEASAREKATKKSNAAQRNRKITCIKGKKSRTVKGQNPQCPQGFTLKK